MTRSIKYHTEKFGFHNYFYGTFVQHHGRFGIHLLQKCIQTVFLAEDLNLLLETQSCALFTHSCISLSAFGRDFVCIHRVNSSSNNEAPELFKTDLTILLIVTLERTGDGLLP